MSGINILVSKDADLGSVVTTDSIPADCQMMMLAYSARRDFTTTGFFERYASAQQKAVEGSGHFITEKQLEFIFETLKTEMEAPDSDACARGFTLGEGEAQAGKMAVIPFSVVDKKPFSLVPIQTIDFSKVDLSEDKDTANQTYRDHLVPVYQRLLITAYHQAKTYEKKIFCRFGLLSTGALAGKIDKAAARTFSLEALTQAIANLPTDFAAHVSMQLVHRADEFDAVAKEALTNAVPAGAIPPSVHPGQADLNVFSPVPTHHVTALAVRYDARSKGLFNRMKHKGFATAVKAELQHENSRHGEEDTLGTILTNELDISPGGHCFVLREALRFARLTTDQPTALHFVRPSGSMAGAGASAQEVKADDSDNESTSSYALAAAVTEPSPVATPIPTASATSSAAAEATASVSATRSLVELHSVGGVAPHSAPTHRRRVSSSFEPVEPALASVPLQPRRVSRDEESTDDALPASAPVPSPVTYASVTAGGSPSMVTVVADTTEELAKQAAEADKKLSDTVTSADV